jgi:hypothetical protein
MTTGTPQVPVRSDSADPGAGTAGPAELAAGEAPLDLGALRDQLAETREEIVRVDSKASVVLAGAGVAVGVILAGLIAGDMKISSMSVVVLVTSALSATATLVGIGCLGAGIYPRCGTPQAGRARYFAEAATYETAEALKRALAQDAIVGDRLVHQLWGLSKAVVNKYVLLRWGIRMLGLAIVLGVVAGVLDVIARW